MGIWYQASVCTKEKWGGIRTHTVRTGLSEVREGAGCLEWEIFAIRYGFECFFSLCIYHLIFNMKNVINLFNKSLFNIFLNAKYCVRPWAVMDTKCPLPLEAAW